MLLADLVCSSWHPLFHEEAVEDETAAAFLRRDADADNPEAEGNLADRSSDRVKLEAAILSKLQLPK